MPFTWNPAAWSDAILSHKRAMTVQTMRAIRDMSRAISEGATGADRVQGRALQVHLGTLNLNGTTEAAILGLDRHTWLRGDYAGTTFTSTAGTLQVAYSANGGSSWGSWQSTAALFEAIALGGSDYAGHGAGSVRVNLRTGQWRVRGFKTVNPGAINHAAANASGTHTVPADCNAVKFRFSAAGPTGALDVDALGGIPL